MISCQENKIAFWLLALFLVVTMMGFVSASNNCASWSQPIQRNDDFQIWQTCNNCTYCNFTFHTPNDSVGVLYQASTNEGWRYYNNLTGTNSSILGKYRYEYYCGNSEQTTTGCIEFVVNSTGDYFDLSQSVVVLGQLGVVVLLLVLGFSFNKEKWKIKTFFFISALLMGIISLNSINMITGISSGLYSMGQSGLVVGITVVSLMIAWFFILMTIEAFQYFKKRKEDKWRIRTYE